MGIFGALKKLLFASKSLAKSGANKTTEAAKEAAASAANQAKESLQQTTSGLRDALEKSTGDLTEKAGKAFEEIKDKSTDLLDDLSTNERVQELKAKANEVADKVANNDKVQELKAKANEAVDKVANNDKIQELKAKANDKLDAVTNKQATDVSAKSSSVIPDLDDAQVNSKDKIQELKDSVEAMSSENIVSKVETKSEVDIALEKQFATTPLDSMEDIPDVDTPSAPKTDSIIDKISNNETVQNIKEKASDLINDIKNNETVQKTATGAAVAGATIAGTAAGVVGTAFDKAKEAGTEATEQAFERIDELKEDFQEKYDNTYEAALRDQELEANKPKFAEETLSAGGSLLDDTDDFFAKAEKFGNGNYDAVHEGKIELLDSKADLDKVQPAIAAGFTDHDGDGNELIDDALIIDNQEATNKLESGADDIPLLDAPDE